MTPGTVVDEELLDEKNNNYLAVIYSQRDKYGFARFRIFQRVRFIQPKLAERTRH